MSFEPHHDGSSRPRLVVFSGNTKRPSNSRALATRIGEAIAAHIDVDMVALDLVDAGKTFGSALTRDDLAPDARQALTALEAAAALVVVTPIHNGSYPGLFKHFIDFLDRESMAGKPVLLGASGGSRRHAMMIENQLMPLFGYFRAQVSAYSVFEIIGETIEMNPDPAAFADRIDQAARHFAGIMTMPAFPDPLSAPP